MYLCVSARANSSHTRISVFFIVFFSSHRPSGLRKPGKGLLFTPNLSPGDRDVHRNQAIVPFLLYDKTTNYGVFNSSPLRAARDRYVSIVNSDLKCACARAPPKDEERWAVPVGSTLVSLARLSPRESLASARVWLARQGRRGSVWGFSSPKNARWCHTCVWCGIVERAQGRSQGGGGQQGQLPPSPFFLDTDETYVDYLVG